MHKKLEADLISLAHSILKMKNKEDVFALKEKSKEVYEKLTMLAFVDEFVNTTPNLKESKEVLIEKVEDAFKVKEAVIVENEIVEEKVIIKEKIVHNLVDEPLETIEETKLNVLIEEKIEPKFDEIIEQPFDELVDIMFSEPEEASEKEEIIEEPKVELEPIKEVETVEEVVAVIEPEPEQKIIDEVVKVEANKTKSLEEELQDTISVDVMADFFENAKPKSLNDKLVSSIQIGLNDRIVFVKNLFNNQQEDYNRVVSQLNTFKTEKEAKSFINTMVKPDYDWSKQEELEARFLEIIERKFA